ncbi:triose-phosphate isomerase [Candidatus Parcubacteria bacterium]|jgi:triosephosphate isomerase (TIM)|nr:triose-phosphate isomerase [Candidatus Parcubacteria bacterium]MBT3948677.1 triose-phosphate isomerase [Candidatus Parcubacteria bacterium]
MKYIFGNWKMYLNHEESVGLANVLKEIKVEDDVKLGVFPSALAMSDVVQTMKESSFVVGSQDAGFPEKGAYTGLVSAQMFKDSGCTHTLVGHSERRHVFGETDEDVRKKLEASIGAGLVSVLCIGETKEDRDNDKTEYRLKKQLMKALEGLEFNGAELILAYEPVWAIGTGDPCFSDEAARVINLIKEDIKQYQSQEVPVLYGGSVSEDNVVSYVSLPEIDGVLVGGASSKSDTFTGLINNAVT